jgi:hypothetical protein
MSFDYQLHDIAGNLGVLLIAAAYLWLQLGKVDGQNIGYSIINGVGAALVLVSLYFEFNFSAFLIESFWLAISIMGLWMGIRRRRVGSGTTAK